MKILLILYPKHVINYYGIIWDVTHLAMGGHKYFITFIDDYSRYGFVELIREKSNSSFKAKVEL